MSEIEKLGKIISAYCRGSEIAWDEDLRLAKCIIDAGYLPVEPVTLEPLGDEDVIIAVCGDCPFEGKPSFYDEDCHACQRQLKGVSQATIAHNEAKGQLYRRKEQ